jgi:choline dehydrogenase-like flavoprotein
LKVYIAGSGDTLFNISNKFQIGLDQLIAVNPHISSPYLLIAGLSVNIPAEARQAAEEHRVVAPFCPPVPQDQFLHSWMPVTSAERMAENEYDVLIVGSGAGGGAALWRLCEQWGNNGRRIGIVERGELYTPTHVANIPTIDGDSFRIFAPPQITDLIGNRLPEYSGLKLIYALGGRSILWGAITPRMVDFELASWPVSLTEMNLYYNIAEEIMNVTTDYARDSSITSILLKRLRENGFYNADYIPSATDLRQTRYGKLNSNVFYSTILLFARALSLRTFDLAVNTYAAEVITENGKAAGVRVMTRDKKSYIIKAKNVVLAASALQTPRILLNSNIPGKAIGRYLINHSYLIATANVNTTNFPEPIGALGILIPESEDRPYQLQLQGPEQYFDYHFEKKPIKNEWKISFFGASGKVEPRYENRVFIEPNRRDEYGVPELQVNFSNSARDEAVLEQMAAGLLRSSSAMQLRMATMNGVPAICRMPPGTDNHEAGTCRMGNDPETSATNPFGQIHGVPGLYIADSSVLPSMGASNPTLTITAMAIRTADNIIRQMQE